MAVLILSEGEALGSQALGSHALMGSHAAGQYRGYWGLPSAALEPEHKPQVLAAKLASSATLGMLGSARSIYRGESGRGTRLGETLLYTYRDTPPHLARYLDNALTHISECFAQSFEHGERQAVECPPGLLPFRRVQWTPLRLDETRKFDPITLDVVRRLPPEVTAA